MDPNDPELAHSGFSPVSLVGAEHATVNPRAVLRSDLARTVPEFDHFNYQEILDWAGQKAEAKLEWCNTFVDGQGNHHIHEKFALWSFYWTFGVIGFDSFKKDEEEQAKMAAALFIFMYLKGIPASTADKAATAYALHWHDKIRRIKVDGNS